VFVQVIKGKVTDAAQVKAQLDRWVAELSPGAAGWLGSTAGVTDDGQLLALARFESEEAARRNSERPEQDAWWTETAALFDGQATFTNSTDVTLDQQGDPDRATFVQIMQGEQGPNPDRVRELMAEHGDEWNAFRPEILGSLSMAHDDGTWTMALYFTSEADAREGERKEPPPELKAQMEEMDQLSGGAVPSFYDIRDPWLRSP
jgi:hypothetical protein